MKLTKKLLFLIPLFGLITSCDPISTNSSPSGDDNPSNPPSSGDGSGHTHNFDGDWHYDEENHWKECECGEKDQFGPHVFVNTVKVAPTYDTEGVMSHICICGYALDDTTIPCMDEEELCDLANENIVALNAFDIFEIKDALIEAEFPIGSEIGNTGKYFGYDLTDNKAVLYKPSEGIVYPASSLTHSYMSFKEVEANSLSSLKEKINQIGAGSADFSSIKLTANIELNNLSAGIDIQSAYPVEINLKEHSISCGNGTSAFDSHVLSISSALAVVAVKNGTITTRTKTGFDLSTQLSCAHVRYAKSFRLTNMTLNCNDERGYAVCDRPDSSTNTKVKVNDSRVNASNIAFAIQGADYIIDNDVINGVVDINGGVVNINKCTISAKDVFGATHVDQTMEFIGNDYLSAVLDAYYDANADVYDTAILSSPDAILVVDRRSPNSTYSSPKVTIRSSSLTPDYSGTSLSSDVAYGYGFRYIDLKNDPNKTTSSMSDIVLSNNTYPCCSDSNPEESNGGFSKFVTA